MIQMFDGKLPKKAAGVFIHTNAVVIGEVTIGEDANIWPGAVVRGDTKRIEIGKRTNIQDGCMLHTDRYPLIIGAGVTVGHGAILHSCDIGDNTLVGMGAIVLDAASVGEECLIAAGTLIPGGKVIPPRSLVMGNPYRIIRQLSDEDVERIRESAQTYVALSKMHIRTATIK